MAKFNKFRLVTLFACATVFAVGNLAGQTSGWKPVAPKKSEKFGSWTLVDSGDVKIDKISVGDVNNVWGVDANKNICQLSSKGWEKKTTGIDVSVASDGTVVVVNEKNEPVLLNKEGKWDVMSGGAKLTSIAVADNDTMWGLFVKGDTSEVYNFDGKTWSQVKSAKGDTLVKLIKLAANAEQVVMGLNSGGQMFRCNSDRIQLVEKTKEIRAELKAKKKTAKKSVKKTVKKSVTPKKGAVKKKNK
jgi:hypothetical protein